MSIYTSARYSEHIEMSMKCFSLGWSFMGGGQTAWHSKLSVFLGTMHYGSPSGGGGWHSLYNLVRETHTENVP